MRRGLLVIACMLGVVIVFQSPVLGADRSEFLDAQPPPIASSPDVTTPLDYQPAAVVHGVYLPPVNNYGEEILAFDNLVGKDIGILNYFVGWYFAPYQFRWLPSQIADQVPADRRPALMLSWEPRGRDCKIHPADQPGDWSVNTSLYDIVDGRCDAYIRGVARELKVMPFDIMMRFAQEMNLNGKPWWVGHYNGDPQLYIEAYRRIFNIFASEGVTNVQWIWGPNYASNPREEWNSMYHYYPGDSYVDWVSLTVFNWGEWYDVPWWSLSDLLDSDTWDHAITGVSCRYAKPIIIELGSIDGTRTGDGTKAGWILDAYQQIQEYPFVKGMLWFNDYDYSNPDGADFRVAGGSSQDPDPWHPGYAYPLPQDSGVWSQAYSTAVAPERFVDHVPSLDLITPPATYCGDGPAIQVPDGILAASTFDTAVPLTLIGLTEDATIAITNLPQGVTATVSDSILQAPWDSTHITLEVSESVEFGPYTIIVTADTGREAYNLPMDILVVEEVHRVLLPLVSADR